MARTIRRSMTAGFIGAIATLVSVAGVAGASPAAGQHSSSGTEHFFIAVADSHESVIAHGLFVATGKDDASHDNYDVLHLNGGTLRIDHPDSQSHFKDKINPKTCFATFTITGKYTLAGGTGRFKKITGHGTYAVSEQGVLARTAGGKCSMKAEPFQVGTVHASGPATLK